MLFQSALYLLFLPTCVVIYWALPKHWRIHFLLLASYIFYATWSIPYALMMFLLVVFNWGAAVAATKSSRYRALVILAAVSIDLAVLALFKYADFFTQNTLGLITMLGGTPPPVQLPNLVLPLGISFFTFEFIHFLVDVKRGELPSTNFSQFHVFSAFFPTQIAGPIKRFQDFLPQIGQKECLTLLLVSEALPLIARGLFKKALLADNLAPVANTGFAATAHLTMFDAWTMILAFAFQIYFDFSGYTDIARGSALLFGFHIPPNFREPYLARNVSDFWSRWHISLSQWLRDYLFIPLGGSRIGRLLTIRNLLITMLLGGLWHGAAWQFVIWGGYWGVVLAAYHQWRVLGQRSPNWVRWCTSQTIVKIGITFTIVLIGWCFFRAPVDEALHVIATMFRPAFGFNVLSSRLMLWVIGVAGSYFAWELVRGRFASRLPEVSAPVQGAVYATLLLAAVIGAPPVSQAFIYFQF